jgi:AcrR family transcriptional regulator
MKTSSQLKAYDIHLSIINTAHQLFDHVGFQKTTLADIARELHMSSSNIYRFFSSKAEINAAVGHRILYETEAALDDIVKHPGSAKRKLRALVAELEKLNARRFMSNRKLHELLETAFNENWPIVREHVERMDKLLTEVISQGDRDGEFKAGDCELAAILVRSACLRFYHPRIAIECAEDPEPTVDQMVDFCLDALGQRNSTRAAGSSFPPVVRIHPSSGS